MVKRQASAVSSSAPCGLLAGCRAVVILAILLFASVASAQTPSQASFSIGMATHGYCDSRKPDSYTKDHRSKHKLGWTVGFYFSSHEGELPKNGLQIRYFAIEEVHADSPDDRPYDHSMTSLLYQYQRPVYSLGKQTLMGSVGLGMAVLSYDDRHCVSDCGSPGITGEFVLGLSYQRHLRHSTFVEMRLSYDYLPDLDARMFPFSSGYLLEVGIRIVDRDGLLH